MYENLKNPPYFVDSVDFFRYNTAVNYMPQ